MSNCPKVSGESVCYRGSAFGTQLWTAPLRYVNHAKTSIDWADLVTGLVYILPAKSVKKVIKFK